MELKGEESIALSQGQVWAALNSPDVLKASIPGCELLEATPEGYRIVILASVGPVRARFNGKLTMVDIKPNDSYTLVFEGSGGVAGFGKGRAEVLLQAVGAGTLLTYTAKAQIGGKIAQVGSRLIDGVAAKMAGEFFTRFKERVAPATATAPVDAVAVATPPTNGGDVVPTPGKTGTWLWKVLAFWRWWPRRAGHQ